MQISGGFAGASPAVFAARPQAGLIGTSAPTAPSRPDFTAMTPAAFLAEMKAMYDRGEIGADTFFSGVTLRLAAMDEDSFGHVGGGRFDFTAIFEDARRFAISHGGGRAGVAAEARSYGIILAAMAR